MIWILNYEHLVPGTVVTDNMFFNFWIVSSNCSFIVSKEDFIVESNEICEVEQLSILLLLLCMLLEMESILSSLLVWSAIDSNFSIRSINAEHDKDLVCLLDVTESIVSVTSSIASVIDSSFAIFSFNSAFEHWSFEHCVVNKWVVVVSISVGMIVGTTVIIQCEDM